VNLGARHFAFTFDGSCRIVQGEVQMVNAKSLAPGGSEGCRVSCWEVLGVPFGAFGLFEFGYGYEGLVDDRWVWRIWVPGTLHLHLMGVVGWFKDGVQMVNAKSLAPGG